MTKYTTRELLKNLIGFVIRKDILIDLLSTHPDLLNHPPFSAGPPSSAENIAWANTGLDITLGKASARISEALERMENVVAHAAQYNLHIQPRTPYSHSIVPGGFDVMS